MVLSARFMKLKHVWSVLCKESTINQDDNVISLYGVLEELNITLTPIKGSGADSPEKVGIPINYEIVSMWIKYNKKEIVKAEIEYTLVSPTGKELLKTIQNAEIPETSKRFRSRMKISGIQVEKEGEYNFRVRIKELGSDIFKTVCELPLEIKIQFSKQQDVNLEDKHFVKP